MRRTAVIVLGLALVAACGKKEADRNASDVQRARDTGAPGGAMAPAPPPARHQVLAEKVIAAIASGEFKQAAALMPRPAAGEVGDLTEKGFRKLRERLAGEKIDLAKATISRVEVTGDHIELVDVFLAYNGKMFQLHFTAMASGGTYGLLGIAEWVRWI